MRFQIQFERGGPKGQFDSVAISVKRLGVSVRDAIMALNEAWKTVKPKKARKAAIPAVRKQEKWMSGKPPYGWATEGDSHSVRFDYPPYKGARVDVENLNGHNLRR